MSPPGQQPHPPFCIHQVWRAANKPQKVPHPCLPSCAMCPSPPSSSAPPTVLLQLLAVRALFCRCLPVTLRPLYLRALHLHTPLVAPHWVGAGRVDAVVGQPRGVWEAEAPTCGARQRMGEQKGAPRARPQPSKRGGGRGIATHLLQSQSPRPPRRPPPCASHRQSAEETEAGLSCASSPLLPYLWGERGSRVRGSPSSRGHASLPGWCSPSTTG